MTVEDGTFLIQKYKWKIVERQGIWGIKKDEEKEKKEKEVFFIHLSLYSVNVRWVTKIKKWSGFLLERWLSG